MCAQRIAEDALVPAPLIVRARTLAAGVQAGAHRSAARGGSSEFDDFRPYAPGDPLTRIDWKAAARTDRLYLRRFRRESQISATVVIDCSASMAFASFDGPSRLRPTKLDRALELAAAVCATVIQQQDRAGVILSNDARAVPPRAGRIALHECVTRLESARPAGKGGVARAMRTIAEQGGRPDLVIIITDALDPPEALLDAAARLRHAGHAHRTSDLAMLQVLTDDEFDIAHSPTARFADPESGDVTYATPTSVAADYAACVRAHIDDLHARLTAMGARHTLHRTSQAPLQAIFDLFAHEGALTR
jgi:uncharacterized protein (DUF58 family)